MTLTVCDNRKLYIPSANICDCGKPKCEYPEYIRITTLPNKLEYNDGESVSIDGIVVTAYCEDGSEWGEVPFEELNFFPTIAEREFPYNCKTGEYCHLRSEHYDRYFSKTSSADKPVLAGAYQTVSWDGTWWTPFMASPDADSVKWHCEDLFEPYFNRDDVYTGYTDIDGLRVYYANGWGIRDAQIHTGLLIAYIETSFSGWLAEYVRTYQNIQTVTVTWNNEMLVQPLSDAYEITVL